MNREELKSALSAGSDCLSPEQLEQLLLDPAKRDSHVEQCPRCQAELAMLKAFESNEPLPDEGAAVAWISSQLDKRLDHIKSPAGANRRPVASAERSWLSNFWRAGSLRFVVPVAAAVIVAVATFVLVKPDKEPELRASATNGSVIYRSQSVTVLSPKGQSLQSPTNLEWQAFPGSERYKVVLMEIDRSPLWTSETNDVSLTIPQRLRDIIQSGKPLLWQVSALDPQGRVLATSQIERFSVEKKSPGNP